MKKITYKNAKNRFITIFLTVCMVLSLAGCSSNGSAGTPSDSTGTVIESTDMETESTDALAESADNSNESTETSAESTDTAANTEEPVQAKNDEVTPNGEVIILCTSDVHCGVAKGFGYAGLSLIKENYEKQGYDVILVDDGDSIQGEAIGTLTKGESNIKLMNAVGYDVAIPGNHEFDYGMEQFLKLADMADFKYISCNFNYMGDLVFDPYTIVEAAGIKIAFVGVTTPESLTSSNPVHFQNEAGETVYGFMQDDDGQGVYDAVQSAVDGARADGADYVFVLGHMGLEETAKPWTYADVISHTNGIDVFLDGHSHDTEQVVMKNKDGKEVVRSAVGTKLNCIGYTHITSEGIEETDILSWPNDTDMPTLLGIENPVKEQVDEELASVSVILDQKVCHTDFEFTINDPVEKDTSGNPVRMVRRAETNLGDLSADAFRDATGADIGLMNGGGIRAGIDAGDVTYGDIIAVFPFNNAICVIEATGQQILDALEWGARGVPEENGGFLHVSGLTYEIDSSIDSPCISSEDALMEGISSGKRRVSNVMVDGKPIDPAAKYSVASHAFLLLDNGDGYTAFDEAKLVLNEVCIDNQALIDYMIKISEDGTDSNYSDPYGQERIVIRE